jgi:hypothetical protein
MIAVEITAPLIAIVLIGCAAAGHFIGTFGSHPGKRTTRRRLLRRAADEATVAWARALRRPQHVRLAAIRPRLYTDTRWAVAAAQAAAVKAVRAVRDPADLPHLQPGNGYSDATGEFTKIIEGEK